MPAHVTTITNNLNEFFSLNAQSNPATLWCAHKSFIRGIILQFCSWVKRQRAQRIDCLLGEIRILETLNKNTADTSAVDKLSKLRSDLRLMLMEQYDGILTHSN